MKKIGAPFQKNDTENKDTKDYKNVKKTRKEKKEERNILKKDKDSKKKQKEVKTKANDNNSPRKKLKIYILVDIMIKKLNEYFLTKKVLIKVRSSSRGKVSCMVDHVKPTL